MLRSLSALSLPIVLGLIAACPSSLAAETKSSVDVASRRVAVELFEGMAVTDDDWSFEWPEPSETYSQSMFAFIDFPKKYTDTGVVADRTNPLVMRARSRYRILASGAGKYQIILRAKNAARFYLDNELVVEVGFMSRNASGHEKVPELAHSDRDDLRPLPPECQQSEATLDLTEGVHEVRLEAMVGGKGLRLELGEVVVAFARDGKPFRLLAAEGTPPVAASSSAWATVQLTLVKEMAHRNANNRHQQAAQWSAFWQHRHDLARTIVDGGPVVVPPTAIEALPANNEIDHFINARLDQEGHVPGGEVDDLAFLRRVSLDTIGTVPTTEDVQQFLADDGQHRRQRAIDRLLEHPGWADHWVSYWQDVLAENPGILKPKLNNTGPFRWWIYESFLDNKPMDRFVTELVLMEGSRYYGGPAGFSMATQNDVPFAAKAHVLSTAFLGVEMKCARCHDAPFHPFKQSDLFHLAALINRSPIKLPATSTVPPFPANYEPQIEVSLAPGSEITPVWPFRELSDEPIVDELVRHPDDSRERLAALLTSPRNGRFAQMMVNRMWHRFLGRGMVEPVDDWHSAESPSHPNLLEYLAQEFVRGGYDWKQLARLILNSQTYQRRSASSSDVPAELFASPRRRRMTAEQIVDSLFAVSGKEMNTEALTLDPEGRRTADAFLNLGVPRRSWQFTSLSNERDRPALALPMAQSVVDLLLAFGWRDARPNPLTVRDDTPTVLQPLTLANGVVGRRAVVLSDDNRFTEMGLEAPSVHGLVDSIFRAVLTRSPRDEERELFVSMLRDGFDDRVVPGAQRHAPRRSRTAVSWSNHLSAEATEIKLEMEREIRAGDPPTDRLQPGWRERMEDSLWALFNTPEFIFVP
jgi:hypothetical protein